MSERALRPSVVHRKIIGCFRSTWGANACAAFASVIANAALKNISSFDAIQNLFELPSLPLPAGARVDTSQEGLFLIINRNVIYHVIVTFLQ
jgi:hypothetical protein